MFKFVFKVISKIIISIFLLYGYNMISSSIGIIIPINIFTITLLTILGFPALFALIFILVVIY